MYNITTTHFRDIYGKLLWVEDLKDDERLYRPGEEFILDEIRYRIERTAVVDNTQHVNVSLVDEKLNVVTPWL